VALTGLLVNRECHDEDSFSVRIREADPSKKLFESSYIGSIPVKVRSLLYRK
jgi:hypothetical protein